MTLDLIPFLLVFGIGLFLAVRIVGRNIALILNPHIEKGHTMYSDIGRKKK